MTTRKAPDQLSKRTKQQYACARKSFEDVLHKKVEKATQHDVETWLHALRMRGCKGNTCRAYLAIIRNITGLAQTLPPKEQVKRNLSDADIKQMLAVARKNYSWLASMLIAGPDVFNWQWSWLYDAKHYTPISMYTVVVAEAQRRGYETFPFQYYGHLVHWIVPNGFNPLDRIWNLEPHEINRRLKGIAKAAGLSEENMNMTTIRYAHERLLARYGHADKAAKAIGIEPTKEPQTQLTPKVDPRLHGVGRRSNLSIQTA